MCPSRPRVSDGVKDGPGVRSAAAGFTPTETRGREGHKSFLVQSIKQTNKTNVTFVKNKVTVEVLLNLNNAVLSIVSGSMVGDGTPLHVPTGVQYHYQSIQSQ